MDQFKHSNAYEVKVHKPDFPSRVQCRLINPAKSNIGKIRKHQATPGFKPMDRLNTIEEMVSEFTEY